MSKFKSIFASAVDVARVLLAVVVLLFTFYNCFAPVNSLIPAHAWGWRDALLMAANFVAVMGIAWNYTRGFYRFKLREWEKMAISENAERRRVLRLNRTMADDLERAKEAGVDCKTYSGFWAKEETTEQAKA